MSEHDTSEFILIKFNTNLILKYSKINCYESIWLSTYKFYKYQDKRFVYFFHKKKRKKIRPKFKKNLFVY